MKKSIFYSIPIIAVTLFSCNHEQLEQQKNQITSLKKEDSLRLLSIQSKDSALNSYLKSINAIEVNLDSLKQRSHMLSVKGESKKDTATIMADLRAVGNLIMENKKEIADLEKKVRNSNYKNAEIQAIVKRLTADVAARDSQIVVLNKNLAETNTTLQGVIKKMNDTIAVATSQRTTIGNMTTQMHTVYYKVGKTKDLVDKGIITKQGFIGKTPVLSSNFTSSSFTQADLTQLSSIPLNGKLNKIVSSHPAGSYKVVIGDKMDGITITDQAAFWSRSKYFVATIK